MRQSSHAGLYTANHDRHIWIQLLEDIAISNGTIVWSHSCPTLWRIGIIRTQTFSSCIMIHHRIHTPRSHSKEQAWSPQLGKVTIISTPIGLRNNRHFITCLLQHTTYYSRTKSGMIYICITREEDHIHFVPTTELHLLFGCR